MVTPLTNKIAPGEEPFVIAVGEGSDSLTDLYAAKAAGGSFVRLTYNRPVERGPRLSPDGRKVAFLRQPPGSPRWSLVILDLLNSAEQSTPLPEDAGAPLRLGWSPDGGTVIVRAGGLFSISAQGPETAPARLDSSLARADSLTEELLGEPPQAKVQQCRDGNPCVLSATGELTLLGTGITGVVRWGGDSLGYFTGGVFEVRPLAGGRTRRPSWQAVPARLRDLTYHSGQLTTSSGVSGRR